jgi:hypothetical protein
MVWAGAKTVAKIRETEARTALRNAATTHGKESSLNVEMVNIVEGD